MSELYISIIGNIICFIVGSIVTYYVIQTIVDRIYETITSGAMRVTIAEPVRLSVEKTRKELEEIIGEKD